jgi:hypothetical protein
MARQDQTHPFSRFAFGFRHLAWGLTLGALGCSQAGPGDSDSASASSVANSGDTASAGPPADESATDWEGTGDETSDPSDADSAAVGESSSEGGMPSGDESSSGGDESSSDDGAGEPPPADLWTPCQTDTDCLSGACVVLSVGGEIQGGFCSNPDCSNPIADCSPPPAGNATPICLDLMDQVMNVHSLCALDCSGGATCPPGLVCMPEVGSICVAPGA